ncbi:MAG: DUF1016 family protein [Bacteroidales bacterium]|nr:DUF1016 family protein [Bacteroidales bacterium]
METSIRQSDYIQAVKAIKEAIQTTRLRTSRLVNRELLSLYYAIGKYISLNSRSAQWGSGAIAAISQSLQQELPGLRGFSEGNMRKMRIFYEEWCYIFENRTIASDDLKSTNENRALSTNDIITPLLEAVEIRALSTHVLQNDEFNAFINIGFTHHYEIIKHTETLTDRLFFIQKCAHEFWNVDTLKIQLAQDRSKGETLVNNFDKAIDNESLRRKAIAAFRDEYNMPFVEINDDNDFPEKQIEQGIVANIKKFLLALGNGFTFMGNQFRVVVDGKEYFIDLLFFNRQLRCLVCIELKYGEFKPEYAGKLNFYLSALDEYVKLPDENPSIGIILCRSKSNKTVEFSFRDTSKPMGVATYRTARELPQKYKDVLPDETEWEKLLE